MTSSARARYLLAMGLVPSAVVACRQTAAPEPVVVAEAGVTPVATAPPVSSTDAVPDASVAAVEPPPVVPVRDAGAGPERHVVREDAGTGVWKVAEHVVSHEVGPGPRTPPRPTCPSGRFCVSGAAVAKSGPSAPAPFTSCRADARPAGADIGGPHVSFDAALTQRERAVVRDACCYAWVNPCPGGRQLWSEGRAHVAEVVVRGDWAADVLSPAPGDHVARERLARHWLAEAAAEHASIASFGRFALQLLALGAPRDLVTAAHAAAMDEIRHAEQCYALAARASGELYGPGALALPADAIATTPAAVALETLRDGCLGETLAARAAAEAGRGATDAHVASVLAAIAADEESHAELAWRTVAWLLATHGGPVRSVVAAFLAELRGASEARSEPAAEEPDDTAHGVLGRAARLEVQASAVREIVLPCLEALLESAAA